MPKFTPVAESLLKSRYYHNEEDWEELCHRVARTMAGVEKTKPLREKWEKIFFEMIFNLKFLPNSPVLWGAGFNRKTLSACFVIPVEDNIDSIAEANKRAIKIFTAGGGVGINFSKLRPADSPISAGGTSSGVVIFLEMFDTSGKVIKQGGHRRSAQMSILHCGHPDIREFINAKTTPGYLTNMNLSVGITNDFMKKATAKKNHDWFLIYHNTQIKDDASDLLNLIAQRAWESGEPGILFLDRINEDNTCPKISKIKGTNPCAEQPLRPNESCTLGSLNLDKFTSKDGIFNKKDFKKYVCYATRFLDNTIDANFFPDGLIDNATKKTRPIGLGIMGLADYFIKRKIVYGSDMSLVETEKVFALLQAETLEASATLGEEKGSFPAFRKSDFCPCYQAMRNSQHNTVAPTGSISIIADCSSGIEPYYSFASLKRPVAGFEEEVIVESKWKEQALDPASKELLVTGRDVPIKRHLDIMARAQSYVDTGISKTISLPYEATVEDVREAIIYAWQNKCKGITVFREQNESRKSLYTEVCPEHQVDLIPSGRCMICPICGFSNRCSIG